MKSKTNWEEVFALAHLSSWPTASISIQNTKPPHESARNIFKDDENEIRAAASNHEYRLLRPIGKVASFVKITQP